MKCKDCGEELTQIEKEMQMEVCTKCALKYTRK
jgi:DNA-directed RNA polymerase subunit RPC12/RpoP